MDKNVEIYTLEYLKNNHSHQFHKENEKIRGRVNAKAEATKNHAKWKPRSKTPNKSKAIRVCSLTQILIIYYHTQSLIHNNIFERKDNSGFFES